VIRTRLGVSVDGFIAFTDGRPALRAMPDFSPHSSYDWPEFDRRCDAVVMGRVPLEAGLGASSWPWPGKRIFVLTSRPLPSAIPAEAVVAAPTPAGLLHELRAAGLQRDAFLLGGQRTLNAFLELGAIDRLELLVLPVHLGDGVPFSPRPAAPRTRSS
jgi:dihydrofolate reductase